MVRAAIRPTKIVGYTRVSTEGQSDDGVSLDAQAEKLQQYAALYGLQIVGLRVDAGLSGKTLQRPGLQAALQDLQEGRAEGLLVVKLDRLTRSVRDLGDLVETYFAGGRWALLSVAEQIDTRTAGGRLVLHILASVSQWEREATGERTRDALTHLRAKGVRMGRAALGWQYSTERDQEGHRVVRPLDAERETIGRITVLRAEGRTLREIARVLDAEGRKTKRGGRWHAQTVANVLAGAGRSASAP